MLTALREEARAIGLTRPEGERAADPALVAREHEPLDLVGRRALVVEDAVEALSTAVEQIAGTGGMVLVSGSLSTVAPVLRWLREA
jgi:dihydrofolate synthase / folylpolyglutamate synthase